MHVHNKGHAFPFESSSGAVFVGRLLLDDRQRAVLAADDDDGWYLDDTGKRLSADALFARSPWSYLSSDGRVKLLCQLLNLRDGSVRFITREQYVGELFRWMRNGEIVQDNEAGRE